MIGLIMSSVVYWNKRDLSSATGVQELEDKEAVTEIHLSFNYIADVSSDTFQGFPNLAYLSLICNNLTAVPSLDSLPLLEELHLANNQIKLIQNLAPLAKLKCLNLRCNRIQCLEKLESCKQLKRLYLSGNRISSFKWEELPDFSALTELGLSSNNISQFADVLMLLERTPYLKAIHIGCNPFTNYLPLTVSSVLTSFPGHLNSTQTLHVLKELSLDSSLLELVHRSEDEQILMRLSCCLETLRNIKSVLPCLQVDGE